MLRICCDKCSRRCHSVEGVLAPPPQVEQIQDGRHFQDGGQIKKKNHKILLSLLKNNLKLNVYSLCCTGAHTNTCSQMIKMVESKMAAILRMATNSIKDNDILMINKIIVYALIDTL